MPKAKILYRANQEAFGTHLRSKEWISYSGKLTIHDRKTSRVTLILTSEILDSIMWELMDEKKEFKGETVYDVYEKLAIDYYRRGILFQC
ncbi:MAG: hypothetical protein JKY52_11815 [Flavobacteriales bacterium]|nr:hypothetical protein [Flavobacteriales bacterium]